MFNVGDLIIGNDRNNYATTHKGSICQVLEKDDYANVLVYVVADNVQIYETIKDGLDLNSKKPTYKENFWVTEDSFDLFKPTDPELILNGLFFRKDLKKLVTLKNAYITNTDKYIRIGEV